MGPMRNGVLLSALACSSLGGCAFSGPGQPGQKVTLTLISADVPLAVPTDPSKSANSALGVTSPSGTLLSVQVSVNISGAPVCSLSLALQHPDGTKIPLLQVGHVPTTFQCSSHFVALNTTFPNQTPTPGAPDLSALNGKPVQGNWQLIATDERTSPDGQQFVIHAWMLDVTVQE